MTQYAFYLNMDNCIGCKVCGMACMEKNDLLPGTRFRRILLNGTGSWEKDASGAYVPNDVFAYSLSMACNHCAHPACVEGCPTGAMTKDEETGIVWNDRSGDRLRDWMGIDRDTFYESGKLAIVPMDFYFPGTGKSGDLPPRKDFADTWHPRLLELMPKLEMTILVGAYATRRYLGLKSSASLTDVVRDYKHYLPTYFPLVHPSPRNQMWMKKNPWFAADVLPDLKARVASLLA